MDSFTTFDIPTHRDRYGSMTMKAVVVADALLPVMADIIEKATRPVLLKQVRDIRVDPALMTEESLEHIRKSVAKELTYTLEDRAKDAGLTLITKPSFEESIEGGVLAFRATATAMPLLEKGLGR